MSRTILCLINKIDGTTKPQAVTKKNDSGSDFAMRFWINLFYLRLHNNEILDLFINSYENVKQKLYF